MKFGLLAIAFLLSAASLVAKTIDIRWPEVSDAAHYEVEIRSGQTVAAAKQVPASQHHCRLKLPPGIFSYRVRAVDDVERPGEWSPASRLVVLPPATAITAPGEDAKLPPASSVLIRWNAIAHITRYRLIVTQEGKEIWRDTVAATELNYTPNSGGSYQVQIVGIVGEAGEEHEGKASPVRTFTLTLPPPTSAVATLKEVPPEPEPSTLIGWLLRSHGSLNLGSALQPYRYSLNSSNAQANLDTSARSAAIVTGGDWWWNSHWGLGGYFDTRFYQMADQMKNSQRLLVALDYRHSVKLLHSVVSLRTGFSVRDFLEPRPDSQHTPTGFGYFENIGTLGPSFSASLTRPLNAQWAISLDCELFLLVKSLDTSKVEGGGFNYPNLRLGMAAHYRLWQHWQASVALSYELQQGIFSRDSFSNNPDGTTSDFKSSDHFHLDTITGALTLTRLF